MTSERVDFLMHSADIVFCCSSVVQSGVAVASSASSAGFSDPRFASLEWRLDVQSHARHAQETHQPTAIVQINTTKGVGAAAQQIQFEMDRGQVANVLLELEKIDSIMNAASAQ